MRVSELKKLIAERRRFVEEVFPFVQELVCEKGFSVSLSANQGETTKENSLLDFAGLDFGATIVIDDDTGIVEEVAVDVVTSKRLVLSISRSSDGDFTPDHFAEKDQEIWMAKLKEAMKLFQKEKEEELAKLRPEARALGIKI